VTRFLQTCKAVLMLSATVALLGIGYAGYQAGEAEKSVKADTHTIATDTDDAVKELKKRVVDTSQNLNALLIQLGLASYEAQAASREQRAYWNKIGKESVTLIADLDATVKGLNETQAGIGKDEHEVVAKLELALVELPPLIRNLQTVTQTVNNQAANPDIKRAIAGLADTSEQTAKTMVQVEGTAANVKGMSDDVRKSVSNSLHPSKMHIFIGWLVTGAKIVAARSVP